MSALYLYALCDAPALAAASGDAAGAGLGTGLAGEALAVHRLGDLAVVAGEVAAAPAPSAAALAAHDAVVRRLAAIAPAVLPCRFGQLVADRAALDAALTPRLAELRAAVSRVAGCVQMTLRIFAGAADEIGGETAAEPITEQEENPPTAGGPGRRYLEARRTAERSAGRAALDLPAVAALRAALLPLVKEEMLEPHGPGRLLLSVHDLVPATSAAEYRTRVESARRRTTTGPRVAVSGPWPPYAFGGAPAAAISAAPAAAIPAAPASPAGAARGPR